MSVLRVCTNGNIELVTGITATKTKVKIDNEPYIPDAVAYHANMIKGSSCGALVVFSSATTNACFANINRAYLPFPLSLPLRSGSAIVALFEKTETNSWKVKPLTVETLVTIIKEWPSDIIAYMRNNRTLTPWTVDDVLLVSDLQDAHHLTATDLYEQNVHEDLPPKSQQPVDEGEEYDNSDAEDDENEEYYEEEDEYASDEEDMEDDDE